MKQHKSMKTWVLLFVVNGLVLALGFLLLLFTSLKALEDTAQNQTEANLRSFAYSLDKLLPYSKSDGEENFSSLDAFVKNLIQSDPSYRITIIAKDGSVIADSLANPSAMENHATRAEVKDALLGKEGKSLHTSSVNGKTLMYFAIPSTYQNENIALRLSMPVEETVFFSTSAKSSLIATSILLFAAVLIASFIISLQIINPMQELKKATEQYRNGNFEYEVLITSPREMAELGDSFNLMSHTIEQNIESMKKLETVRKDFVANVSHELKTPVTSIKGFTETLMEGAIDDKETSRRFLGIINTQCTRLMSIMEDLLTLSRLENEGAAPDKSDANIVEIVQKEIDTFSSAANQKSISLNLISSSKNISANVNSGLIEQAVGNLIINAIKYCPENSKVFCSVDLEPNDKVQIVVEDNGFGVPNLYRERIFERFFRVDKGRSREEGGTGLGLSIVKHIVTLHGGTVIEKNRPDGKAGARFEITLPVC
ncbi:MAG: ATP-binding protein [Treponema sp.]